MEMEKEGEDGEGEGGWNKEKMTIGWLIARRRWE